MDINLLWFFLYNVPKKLNLLGYNRSWEGVNYKGVTQQHFLVAITALDGDGIYITLALDLTLCQKS